MNIETIPYDDPGVDTNAITRNILTPDQPEAKTPAEVLTAIDTQIKQLKKDIEQDGGTAIQNDTQIMSNQQEFLMDVVAKLEMLKHELSKHTQDGMKRAQIAWAQVPNYMWKYVPVVVSQYIYRAKGSSGDSLISSFYNNKPFKQSEQA